MNAASGNHPDWINQCIQIADIERRAIRQRYGPASIVEPPTVSMAIRRPLGATRARTEAYASHQHAIHASLQAAITALVCNIPTLFMADTPAEKTAAWNQMFRAVVAAGGVGAGCGALRALYESTFTSIKPDIMSICTSSKLTELAKLFVKKCLKAPAAFLGGVVTATVGVLSSVADCIWNLLRWGYSSIRGDHTTAAVRLYAAKTAINPSTFIDNAAFYTISQIANGLVSLLIPTLPAALITGPWAPAIIMGMYAMGQVTAYFAHSALDIRDQWLPWARRMLGWERASVWRHALQLRQDDNTDEEQREAFSLESHVPTELCCGITWELVTDPIRHKNLGCLYDRASIRQWLSEEGIDPILRTPSKMSDYVDSPDTKQVAYRIAKHYGLVQVYA